nr:hypothetical protein [Saprospiraceae bacterium]
MIRIWFLALGMLFFLVLNSCGQDRPQEELPVPEVSWGEIHRLNPPSAHISPRFVDVLLPEGYDSLLQYPVLYMQDGQMLFDSATARKNQPWKLAEILAKMTGENLARPPIVVGIHSHAKGRSAEYFPNAVLDYVPSDRLAGILSQLSGPPMGNRYLKFVVEDVKPLVDSLYSTYSGPGNNYIAGAGEGAIIALYALCEYPDIFGNAACLSTQWTGPDLEDDVMPSAHLEYMRKNLPAPGEHKIYFDCGDQGADVHFFVHQQEVNRIVMAKGYTPAENWITRYLQNAGHSEKAWGERFDFALEFLFKGID